jgi:hypothetical protein
MDVLEKAKRIEALAAYVDYKENHVPLNYKLNQMFTEDPKVTHNIKLKDIYQNEYRVYEDKGNPFLVEPEQWETIVSDIYNQFYHISFSKAQKAAIEKITILEIEQNIKQYESK